MPGLPETATFELAPDWVCEVILPRSESFDREEELGVSHRVGGSHVWLVSPQSKTLDILRLTPEGYLIVAIHTAPRTIRAEPFDAIEIDLELLFGKPRSSETSEPPPSVISAPAGA